MPNSLSPFATVFFKQKFFLRVNFLDKPPQLQMVNEAINWSIIDLRRLPGRCRILVIAILDKQEN
jgi:hypothetical protein